MPFRLLDVPDVDGWEVFPAMLVCQGESVSGDAIFEEVQRTDGKHLFLLVDVCGHGPRAARIVSELLRVYLPLPRYQDNQPATLLKHLNGALQNEFLTSGRFVAALAILADSNGSLVVSNAGQPEPWLGLNGMPWHLWAVSGGPFLGVTEPDTEYTEDTTMLAANGLFLAFSDGVTEAGRGKSDLFQTGHLQAFLDGLTAGLPAGLIIMRLLQALQLHAGADWPEDDTTALSLLRR